MALFVEWCGPSHFLVVSELPKLHNEAVYLEATKSVIFTKSIDVTVLVRLISIKGMHE